MANVSSNISSDGFGIGIPYQQPLWTILVILHSLILTIGVPGNLLIIFTILYFKHLRVSINMFILNLALADIVFVSNVEPFILTDIAVGRYPLNQEWCQFNAAISQNVGFVSYVSIIAIAFSRYLKVCKTHIYNKYLGKEGTLLLCIGSWLIGPIISIYMLVNKTGRYNKLAHVCMVNTTSWLALSWISILLRYIPAYIATLWCYWKVWRHVVKSDKNIRQRGNEAFARIRHNIDQSNHRSNFAVYLLYILLQTPFPVLQLVSSNAPASVHGVFLVMFLANSSINVIIYGAMNKNIHKTYRHLLPFVRRIHVQPNPTPALFVIRS